MKLKNTFRIAVCLVGACILLSACQQKNAKQVTQNKAIESSNQTTLGSSDQSTATSNQADESVASFSGELVEGVIFDPNQPNSATLKLKNIAALNDPKGMLASFQPDGVTLNARRDQLGTDFSEDTYQTGTIVYFQLEEHAAMTMSIPPQILARSIKRIALTE